ncbi:DUF2721 domain-containing protein [Aristophania vespae]|uniref:DUF2721 domain-containing protein n=1 Tax=Aristophania vespae TaxID=2697033 RepID=A0A6P1NCW8_9PROT|nr:DUF2721 domain-containing protein [Aristophania vespae]QHI96166.1 DUF2721 domain-containing protein [Aristophania vespae]UMM63953.1 hypothetical protein DM15PD_09330 [Aristophania vespae]
MNFPLYSDPETVDSAAHLIQVALTPVFMLSGIGTLINVFNTRLSRVSDHLEDISKRLASPPSEGQEPDPYFTPARLKVHQARLRRRIFVLDIAIILNGCGGAFTCGSAIALFLGSIRDSVTSTWLIFLFGAALSCTVAALTAFLIDTLLSWHGLKHDREDILQKREKLLAEAEMKEKQPEN